MDLNYLDSEYCDKYILTFGLHKGRSMSYVIKTHPSYAVWLCTQPWFRDTLNYLYNGSKNDPIMDVYPFITPPKNTVLKVNTN